MNAPIKIVDGEGAPLTVVCNTSALTVTVAKKTVRLSPTNFVMVALLAKAFPETVPRDRMMKTIFRGSRGQKDPAMCLRQTMTRTRDKLQPLGLTIRYTPNPGGSDLPGFYALGRYTGQRS